VRSTTSWAFGFSLTILLIALWGRAVVVDTDRLADSLAPLSDAGAVVDVFAGWMADELIESGYAPELVDPAVEHMLDASVTAEALDSFVGEVVDAAASTDPAGSSVDMAALFAPAVPEMAIGLGSIGITAPASDVASVVAGLDPMVIRGPDAPSFVGAASPAAARLGTAALLATLGLIVFGYLSVAMSEDRVTAVRELFNRVAVGGFGFAILLLIGSWITDPRGGRAPVSETVSAIASSKWMVPLQVGVAAAVVAGAIYVTRRLVTREEGSHSAGGPPTPPAERQLSRSGSR
jgi:hypothetical protein